MQTFRFPRLTCFAVLLFAPVSFACLPRNDSFSIAVDRLPALPEPIFDSAARDNHAFSEAAKLQPPDDAFAVAEGLTPVLICRNGSPVGHGTIVDTSAERVLVSTSVLFSCRFRSCYDAQAVNGGVCRWGVAELLPPGGTELDSLLAICRLGSSMPIEPISLTPDKSAARVGGSLDCQEQPQFLRSLVSGERYRILARLVPPAPWQTGCVYYDYSTDVVGDAGTGFITGDGQQLVIFVGMINLPREIWFFCEERARPVAVGITVDLRQLRVQ